MNRNKRILLIACFIVCLFGTSLMTGFGFSTDPIYTDPTGDGGGLGYEDIINIWIDNNNTHIMFKVDLVGPYNQTLSGQVIYALISTNPLTGSDTGFALDFLTDYTIGVSVSGGVIVIVFYDYADFPNSLTNNNQLGYYIQSNGNTTIEFGYKLRTYQGGKGYLDLTLGQTIEVKFYAGGDSDIAPDDGLDPISYTLKNEEMIWIIIILLLFPVIGVALGAIIYYRRKDIL